MIRWQRRHGRHDLPWQRTSDPYRIWVSEIMLQQTQVATVTGYYTRFVGRFPDVFALAGADIDEVLRHWSGLGYYGRARNLHRSARTIATEFGGAFPRDPESLQRLPGIGRSTAAAIAVFAFGARAPILDGNVKRVFCRVFGVEGFPGERPVEDRLWALAQRELPRRDIERYTQGLMDLGATVCTRVGPRCGDCPLAAHCDARLTGRIAALPWPRPARTLPLRDADLVLALTAPSGPIEVLLERRAPRGIWGGLWSLPEFAPPAPREAARSVDSVGALPGARAAVAGPRAAVAAAGAGAVESAAPAAPAAGEVAAWAQEHLGLVDAGAQLQTVVRHAFTHFRLHARVWRVVATPGAAAAGVAAEGVAAEGVAGVAVGAGGAGVERRWVRLPIDGRLGLPRPIERLLATVPGLLSPPAESPAARRSRSRAGAGSLGQRDPALETPPGRV